MRYVCHGLNLKFYLEQGLELVEIHRGITFYQECFIRNYIDMCTQKRANAPTKSEGNIMKLLSNSLYGKMIEGTGKRMDCRFNYTDYRALLRFSDPLYKGVMICGDNFSVTFHKKKYLRMKQSWAVGFTILELSKLTMQRLMYEYIKPAFDGRVSTLMSDTDSVVLLAPGKHPDDITYALRRVMDFSNHDSGHAMYNISRKNEVGLLKNEVPNDEIIRFAGIRSKTYAYEMRRQGLGSRAKGIKRACKNKMNFDDFTECILNISTKSVTQVSIASKSHQNKLVESEKIAFSSFDDKRFLMCAIHSVPYGSWLIKDYLLTRECFFCAQTYMLV